MVKSFEVCELPVRCAKFIVRKSWFAAAADDMHIRVSSGSSSSSSVGGGGGGGSSRIMTTTRK